MDAAQYLSDVVREFRKLKSQAEGAMGQLDEAQFFTALDESGNSVANIVKHLSGNMWSRWRDFLGSDGEKPDRNRDQEFLIDGVDTKEALWDRWESGWRTLFEAIEPLAPEQLEETVTIRGKPLSVVRAINRQLTHYAGHVGQIVFLSKHLVGADWQFLSIPPGGSEAFNSSPNRHVDDGNEVGAREIR